MKISIDVTKMHSLNKQRGVGFYTQSLVQALKQFTNEDIFLTESPTDKAFDVIHYPFFDLFKRTLPMSKKAPTVVTIHDVTPLVFKEHYPPGIKGKINLHFQRLSLKNVDSVMTDSEASKKDLIQYLPLSEKQVHVVFPTPSSEYKIIKDGNKLSKIKTKYNLPKKYAIFGGSLNWNKNVLNQIQAAVECKKDVVLFGKGWENRNNLNHPELRSFKEFIRRYEKHSQVHILGFVPTEDLVLVMNGAEMLLFASFYEGFGLPILEAQLCGIPVITSNISSMPEVAGNGAILVEPKSVDSIKEAIMEISLNASLKKKLIAEGFNNVKRFTLKSMAQQAMVVYQQVLKDR